MRPWSRRGVCSPQSRVGPEFRFGNNSGSIIRSRGDSLATRREQAMHDERVEKHREMVGDARRRMRKGLKNP